MSDKKAAGPTPSPEDEALQKRVEMIMGERNADGITPAKRESKFETPPPIDIFKDPATAPAVSAELLKQIGAEPKTASSESAAESVPAEPAASEEVEDEPVADSTNIDDAAIDQAVDDIAVNESDSVLATEDAATKQVEARPAKQVKSSKFKRLFKHKWLWIITGIVLITIFAVPMTRYTVLGLVIKQSVTVSVSDSKTHTPVSSAIVTLAGKVVKSDAYGKAVMKVPIGQTSLTVTKQYYKSFSAKYSVGLKSGQTTSVQLVATGRQVPVTVINRITGKPLAGAQINVLDTTAKTNSKGMAIVVLPTTAVSDSATVSLTGYNTAKASVQVTSLVIPGNTISLTPAGHIYFLSNLSGKIDVVKSNLDGTGRQTVLAGTGKEDPNTTSLLASRDWRFLVLKAQRDTAQPALYLIDTSTDKVTNFDSGDADFSLVGWYGHALIYDVVRNGISAWQNAHEVVKSYNAEGNQTNLIDQNQAEGTSTTYAYQGFYNFYIANGLVTYNTQWYTYNAGGGGYDVSGKTDTIRGLQANGQGKKDYQTFPASGVGYIQAALYQPQSVYYAVYNYNDNKTTYYNFDNQAVATVTNLDQSTFNKTYPTYLLSPAGSQTFWSELRDGKNTLFVGSDNAANQKTVASLSDYAPYGWYTDNYLLMSKGSSELYIMPATGLSDGQQPNKITDYYKPTQTYTGSGYSYGGL